MSKFQSPPLSAEEEIYTPEIGNPFSRKTREGKIERSASASKFQEMDEEEEEGDISAQMDFDRRMQRRRKGEGTTTEK